MNTKAHYFWMRSPELTGISLLLAGLMPVLGQSAGEKQPYTSWGDGGGGGASMQYSALTQINKENVGKLELAWTHLVPGRGGGYPFCPMVVDDVMYVIGEDAAIVALDATTGKQIWSHPVEGGTPTARGINYWESKDRSDRRLIFSVDSYLQEVDARTGLSITTFGTEGRVNMREGLGRDPANMGQVESHSPGHVFENLILLGSAPGELYDSPPGDLRAYDVLTGKTAWTFHTVPRPGEFGYDTYPPDAWKQGGGNNTWSEFSVDEKRGIAYFPLGSPTMDLYGADRVGADVFGNCLLALDARTGKRLWHFQTVHHDLWDYDLATGPKLLTVRHDGKMVDIVAQASKTGFVYVFNRVTGEPLWPIEERPVPKSDVPMEHSWPTQPYPTKPPPFGVQKFGVDQINPYLDESERSKVLDIMAKARNEGIFTPPTVGRTQIEMPSAGGSANWGSDAGDPATGMLYIRAHNGPDTRVLTELKPTPPQGGPPGLALYWGTCYFCHGAGRTNMPAPADIKPDFIREAVRHPKGKMPPIPESMVSAEDLDKIIDYLANPAPAANPVAGGQGADQLAANLANPVADGRGAGQRPRRPRPLVGPPPPGQIRYMGPYGNPWTANGMPVIAPPWTELVAYDLNEGTIKWRVPLGTVPALAARGITNTGSTHARNGPIVTAGGLIFVGTGGDRYIHAFDKDTGKILWETKIEAGPDGIPAVYEAGGRQYVAFSAGGRGQGYYAFALPNSDSKSQKKGD
jgi:quinoprotein glucose dehydrogenase